MKNPNPYGAVKWKTFMKAFVLLFLMTIIFPAVAQSQKIVLTGNNLTLKMAFSQIEKQTGMSVDYDSKLINDNAQVSKVPYEGILTEVMKFLLMNTDCTYSIQNSHIIIMKRTTSTVKDKEVSGIVTDVTGLPVPGATVILVGSTSVGTMTGADGKFTVTVPPAGKLQISFIGFVTQTISVGSRDHLSITLLEDNQMLDDVVVIGYGTQKKVNLSGAVAFVNMETLGETRSITNMAQSLQGVMAGLLSQQSSGQPGSESTSLLIRGQGTLNNSAPLIVIDGIVGSLSDVAPGDVASISVLKDAASAAIYGSRAANGVILVTTKLGSKDKIKITYNTYMGTQKPTFNIDVVDDQVLYMETLNKARQRAGQPVWFSDETIEEWRQGILTDPITYPSTNWFKEVYKSAFIQEHTLQASGATEKIDYLLSVNYLGNEGSMPESDYMKYSLRANVGAQINNWFKINAFINGYRSIQQVADVSTYMGYISNSTPGTLPVSPEGRFGGDWVPGGQTQANNVFANFYETDDKKYINRIQARLNTIVDITKNLKWNTSIAATLQNDFQKRRQRPTELWNIRDDKQLRAAGVNRLTLYNEDARYERLIIDSYMTYSIPEISRHKVDMLVGFNSEQEKRTNTYITGYDILSYETPVMNTAASSTLPKGGYEDRTLRSYFGRINYNFKDRYLLEANLRIDGSSKFAEDNRWGKFPSFSAAWRISEENFMREITPLNNLKLRASWGQLGNNRSSDYGTQAIYKATYAVLGESVVKGAAPTALVEPSLVWETTTMTNIGMDINMFRSRLGVVADVFYKKTDDILIQLPVPLVLGGKTAAYQNAGVVVNRGIEISASWNDKIGSVNYGISGNYTFVRNKVEKYRGDVGVEMSGNRYLREGLGINRFYVREVDCIATEDKIAEMLAAGYTFYPSVPKPGDFIYKDQQEPGEPGYLVINDDDRVVKGSSTPEHYFGLTLAADWNGFDFSALFQGVTGINRYLNSTWYTNVLKNGSLINRKFLDGWSEDNPNSKIPAITTDDGGRNTVANDYWLQDASYIRLKNIQLGYTFPTEWTKKLFIQRFRLHFSAENLFTITPFEGLDPELSGSSAYPNMKRFVGGLSITF